jgi:hypothetical protein
MTIHTFTPRDGAFVRELLGSPRERYDLRAWVHGYAIYDRGDVIATFHGPQFDLASKVLRLLREEERTQPPRIA